MPEFVTRGELRAMRTDLEKMCKTHRVGIGGQFGAIKWLIGIMLVSLLSGGAVSFAMTFVDYKRTDSLKADVREVQSNYRHLNNTVEELRSDVKAIAHEIRAASTATNDQLSEIINLVSR